VNALQILVLLRSAGAEVSVVGDRLKVVGSTGSLTPDMRARIAEQKHELIALLRDPARLAEIDNPPLVPIARGKKLPLSLFQQRLWIVEQLRREQDMRFNMVTSWVMPGSDLELLKRAIVDVVRRHEILRSTILNDGADPYVNVLPPESASIEVSDLRALSGADQQRTMDAELIAAITEPFDLRNEPPLRWRVYVTEGGRLTTRICADHIAVDEWSFSLLRKELDDSLAACASGIVLPPPALQYVDYAAWERRRQSSPAVAGQIAWWVKRLADLPQFCALPPDRHGRSATGGTFSFKWDTTFTAGLRELARSRRSTLFMVLFSALGVLLRAATGRGDIVVGTFLGARERVELESMIGGFVDIVALRLALEDDPNFNELVSRARETVLDAYDHREAPFEMLVERLNPVRSLDFTPLFQVSVVMHNASTEMPSQIYSGGVRQNMTWYARETQDGLQMSLEYRSDLYHASTVERIARQLETLLRAAIVDPGRPVSKLPLMTLDERRQVTEGFNATHAAIDSAPISVQFESQAARTPGSIAMRCRGEAVTYDALNRRANRLARHLRDLGAGPGVRVGICLDRSANLLAVLLAVAKTGAAYVPLDPGFPAARLEYMVGHCEIALLVVDAVGRLDAVAAASCTVDLDAAATAIDHLEDGNLGIVPAAKEPAYVIYTSGSTGRPNGVVVSHAALANCLGAMRREPGLTDADIVAAVTTVSFDIAALELFLPLLVGARVVIVPRTVATDGGSLAALLVDERVTVMQATPATWRLLLEAGWRGAPTFVAWCGGDVLPPDLAGTLSGRVGGFWNLYGPTETTIWSTVGRVDSGKEPVTIGRPIANTQVYILDSGGEPLPVGMPGEIWIGGAGVASGYWRNPELTAKKFLPDPFAARERRGTIYRTGDMGRWLTDGRIVHMGRLDQQLKLRGFRIEPGEIEAALTAHAAIREAVVVMRGDSPERERLVAYIVFRTGQDLTTSEVREHLRSSLPDYMIPSVFLTIDAVPWTPNGKIDRRALPDPFRSGSMASSDYVPPAAGAEQAIARIWADALALERVGADDNFFDLGGHSLLGLRVAATIYERTGWRMPPYMMFQQTLRQIAASLTAQQPERGAAG
jgi:amino acid adenylation domain-containing protein